MPIQIGQKPAPTFQQPLELLSDCHRRVESFLRSLIIVAEQARGSDLNPQRRDSDQRSFQDQPHFVRVEKRGREWVYVLESDLD